MNRKTAGFLTIIGLLSVTSFFSINLFFQQRSQRDELDINTFPFKMGEWVGKDIEIGEYNYKILQTRNLIVREYNHPSGARLNLNIIYSETNRSVFHPPEVCLMGSGVEILDKKTEKIQGRNGETIFTNKIFLEKEGMRTVSLYCYKIGGFYTENFYLQQVYFALNQIFNKGVRGATIHAHMPLMEDEETTMAVLKDFFIESAAIIDSL